MEIEKTAENSETSEESTEGTFYKKAIDYWSKIPPTVDGMMGGFGFISNIDIRASSHFITQLLQMKVPPGRTRALDCGAGIGRVTKNLLLNYFAKVDLVEQNPAFVEEARCSFQDHKRMGNFYCSGLQDFTPEPQTYDVIWCQWVLVHLTDEDLLSFLHSCKSGLKERGLIVMKENVTQHGNIEEDFLDSSVTRSLLQLTEIIQKAGLRIIKQRRQKNFPSELFPVYMIAARPVKVKPVSPSTEDVENETILINSAKPDQQQAPSEEPNMIIDCNNEREQSCSECEPLHMEDGELTVQNTLLGETSETNLSV